jgi:hypothetical protein
MGYLSGRPPCWRLTFAVCFAFLFLEVVAIPPRRARFPSPPKDSRSGYWDATAAVSPPTDAPFAGGALMRGSWGST